MTRKPTPFVVFATQRTGSSWVTSTLGSHSAVDTFGELFEERAKQTHYFAQYSDLTQNRWRVISRPRRTFAYLTELFASRSGVDAIGFKLMYNDVKKNPSILGYIALHRVRVIHLVRANLLDILVSTETALARGRFHSSGEDMKPVTVRIDPATVVAQLDGLEKHVRLARRLLALTGCPRVEVSYESLVADPGSFSELLRFLRVEDAHAELSSELQKLNKLQKHASVSNYREVESVLAETRFASFLDSEPQRP